MPVSRRFLPAFASLAFGCHRPLPVGEPLVPTPPPVTSLTYLGMGGWEIDSGSTTVLVDPAVRHTAIEVGGVPDEDAIASSMPPDADVVLVAHTSPGHLLDVPVITLRTGAVLMGTSRVTDLAFAAGVSDDHVVIVRGGEVVPFAGTETRVIAGPVPEDPDDDVTLGYVVRIDRRTIAFVSATNYVEEAIRRAATRRPDVAVVADVYDPRAMCRVLQALGNPPVVVVNPDVEVPASRLDAIAHACAPRALVPARRTPLTIRAERASSPPAPQRPK